MNYEMQIIKGIPLRLIKRNYKNVKAKRFAINNTNQNIWIPNTCLEKDGTIISDKVDWIINSNEAMYKCKLAGVKI
ncbi:MAG: hypothetical protein ACRDA3_00080 [Peptostreptococcaceae bacterium]